MHAMKSCDELPSFHKIVENGFDAKIKTLRRENGGKYTFYILIIFLN